MFVTHLNNLFNQYTTHCNGTNPPTTPTLTGFVTYCVNNPPPNTGNPRVGTVTHHIFTYCNNNPTLTRKQVVTNLVTQGYNPYTVVTQYQRWYTQYHKGNTTK